MQTDDLVIKIIMPFVSAFLGGVIVALVNYYLNKHAIKAGVEKTKAETDKIRAETLLLERNIKREIEGVETKQAEQGKFVDMFKFFIVSYLGKYELNHLEGLEKGKDYPFDKVSWTFEQELVRLRSLGLINHFSGKGIVAMKKEGKGELNRHFHITDLGREYLKWRGNVVSEDETSEGADAVSTVAPSHLG